MHAKSTAITFGYGLATLLFRERKFLLLVSDTESQAAMFLGMFKQELTENQTLIDLFGIKKNDKGLVEFKEKGSETDVIVEFNDGHKFRIIAKGAEQKLRGLLWNGSRPDIILCDDMENDELVMNKDRRLKMRNWFKGALLPSLADRGIVRMVGTILHSDSLLEQLMPNPSDKLTVTEPLKQWSSRRLQWKSVKYRAHTPDFKTLLWPSKKTAEFFKMEYEEALRTGMTDVYSREYLNYPIDEAVSFFKRTDFVKTDEEDQKKKLNYYVCADLAISETETADYSVFIVGGVDDEKKIHIKDVIRERMDGREIVDTLIALQRLYDPVAVGIEDMQVSKSIGPFLREEMIRQNCFLNLYLLKHGGKDKLTRARSIQARMRAKGVKFDTGSDWFSTFENELLQFPRGKHDDQVDAFSYLGLMLHDLIEAPSKEELDEEEYERERDTGGVANQGRNRLTGY